MASARKEIMFAVSRTVSPWAICDFSSSSSDSPRPRALTAEAKLKRVRVDLSRKMETASPVSNTRNGLARLVHRIKALGHQRERADLVVGLLPGQQEIFAVGVRS